MACTRNRLFGKTSNKIIWKVFPVKPGKKLIKSIYLNQSARKLNKILISQRESEGWERIQKVMSKITILPHLKMMLPISHRMRSWWKVTIIMTMWLGAKTSTRSGNAHCKKFNALMVMMSPLWGETLSCTLAINMHQVNVRRASSSAALASYATWENLKVQSMKHLKLLSWTSLSQNSMYIKFSNCPLLRKKWWLSTTITRMQKHIYSKVWVGYLSHAMDSGQNWWGWMTVLSIWLEGYPQPINSLRSLRRPQNLSLPWSVPISPTATCTIRSRCLTNSECIRRVRFTGSRTRSSSLEATRMGSGSATAIRSPSLRTLRLSLSCQWIRH